MFLTEGLESPNQLDALSAGTYKASGERYASSDGNVVALWAPFSVDGGCEVVCVDLLICKNGTDVMAHDFLKMDDGRWRDSFGRINESLLGLIPGEMKSMTSLGEILEISVEVTHG